MERFDEPRYQNKRRQRFGRDAGNNFYDMNQQKNKDFDERGIASDIDDYRKRFSDYYPERSNEYVGNYYGPTERINEWDARSSADREERQRGEHYGKGPKGWKRSDERIREDASEALYKDWHVDASHIEVSVKDACVYLRGSVGSREDKRRAERCVEHLSGVDDVYNELKINRQSDTTQGLAN